MKSVAAQIIDAISDENVLSIELLFSRNPELLNQHTMMAGQTWLGHAASSGKLLAVKKLIELGADPNIGDRWDGSKSLCSAGHSGNPEIVRCLLEHGAEIDTDAVGDESAIRSYPYTDLRINSVSSASFSICGVISRT